MNRNDYAIVNKFVYVCFSLYIVRYTKIYACACSYVSTYNQFKYLSRLNNTVIRRKSFRGRMIRLDIYWLNGKKMVVKTNETTERCVTRPPSGWTQSRRDIQLQLCQFVAEAEDQSSETYLRQLLLLFDKIISGVHHHQPSSLASEFFLLSSWS